MYFIPCRFKDSNPDSFVDLSPDRFVFLAQVGTFSLEFGYLSDVLNDPIYRQRAVAVIEKLSNMTTMLDGLYPASIHPNLKEQRDDYFSAGGQCDSFYEYLLKYWLYTGKRDTLHYKMYKKAVDGIRRHLIQRRSGRYFVVNRKGEHVLEEQEHLACFLPGLLALGAHEENDKELLELAGQLTESCYQMYHKQRLGLSPEFININNMRPTLHRTYWSMRPETVESLFVMWRLTKDPKYRRWGYEIAHSIEKYAKVEGGGYAGIENILSSPSKMSDRQESYFLAETLKYLYLLFGPSDVLPLDQWVFNTEAHPFPINWRGVAYSHGQKPEQKSPVSDAIKKEKHTEQSLTDLSTKKEKPTEQSPIDLSTKRTDGQKPEQKIVDSTRASSPPPVEVEENTATKKPRRVPTNLIRVDKEEDSTFSKPRAALDAQVEEIIKKRIAQITEDIKEDVAEKSGVVQSDERVNRGRLRRED